MELKRLPWQIYFEMHKTTRKKHVLPSEEKLNRNISSLTMERHWPQLVLNKKFATMSERKLPSHIDLGLILL